MTLDEMISDIDYVVNKSQLATLELGDESTKQLLHWLEDYKRLQSESSWIPCSERMPEDYISVLLYGNRIGIVKGFFTSFTDYYIADSGNTAVRKSAVTHWMPLPEPPARKDDTHDND